MKYDNQTSHNNFTKSIFAKDCFSLILVAHICIDLKVKSFFLNYHPLLKRFLASVTPLSSYFFIFEMMF